MEPLTLNCCHRSWFERFEFFLLAGDHLTEVPELAADGSNSAAVQAAIKKNLALFISKTDEGIFKLLKSLTSPRAVGECTYDECKKLILDHLAPAPTKFAQRYKLRSCVQDSEETTATYISRLRTIANECEFENYNEAILDQLLAGLRDQKVVSELLTKEDLTLETAVREALSREQATKEARYMHSGPPSSGESSKAGQVNYVRKPQTTFKRTIKNPYKRGEGSNESKNSSGKQKGLKCNRCGLRGHDADNCQVQCYNCSKIGHTAKKCKQPKRSNRVNNIEQEELRSGDCEFGMDESCENVLDDELYSEYYDSCNLVETSIENGNSNTCSYLCANLSKCVHLNDSKSSAMYVADTDYVMKSSDFQNDFKSSDAKLIDVPKSNVRDLSMPNDFADNECLNKFSSISNADSTISENNADLSLVSDEFCSDINLIDVSKPYVEVRINGKLLCMEFDSGSAVSVVSKRALSSCGLSNLTLTPSRKTLRVANGQIKTVDGCAVVDVVLNGEKARDMQLYVAEDFPSLFGRPWIVKFCGQNWLEKLLSTRLVNSLAPDKSQQVSVSCESCSGSGVQKGAAMLTDGMTVKNGWKYENTCTDVSQCRSVSQLKQSEVFKPGLGLVKGVQASLVLKDNSKPIMLKARSLPYALRDKVENELNAMVEAEILTKVDDSPWGTPIVPVKKDGGQSVRICGDYKSTLNKCVSTRQYPLPTVEECFNSVQGGQKFSKIDIKKAYNNLLIREEDRVLTTLNTHKGLLSQELGCLTWGARVVIPAKLRSTVMAILHSTHIGVSGMKSLARSYVYWPRLDTQIEDTARTCETCGKYGKNLPKIVDHPWAKTTAPFQRVHADFAGPFLGSMWLLLVDSYSKWPEIIQMNANTTSSATIRAFRSIFSRTGIPICLVTDNGPQFVSDETKEYLKSCGIKHVTVPTYSPKSNGICERLVQSFKTGLRKMYESCKDVSKNLYDFLLTYRNTPHSTTGQTPAVLAFNRTLRSKLHRIQPADRMRKQELQSEKLQDVIDEHPKTREFRENQLVFVKMDDKSHWQQARVIRRCGDNSNNYEIQHEDRLVKKHADVIKPRYTPVISMKRTVIPDPQKALLTRDLARSNLKFQKLDETLERRRLRLRNLGVLESQESKTVGKQMSPVKASTRSGKVASPVKNIGKQVRVSELVRPAVSTSSPEPQLRPTRSAKSNAIIKMKSMS